MFTSAPPPLVAALGGKQGIVDGAVPPVLFVAVNALAGLANASRPLLWATGLSLGSALVIIAVRWATGGSPKGAVRGLAALALALGFAAVTGEARDFFLPGIVVDAAYCVAFALSVVVGRPVVGYLHAITFHLGREWRHHPRLRRVFALATLGWAGAFGARAGAQALLYVADQPELLGLTKVVLGWPLTALVLVLTLRAVRRVDAGHCPA